MDNGLTALLISDTLTRHTSLNNQTALDEDIHRTPYKRNSKEVESDSDCETNNEDNESDIDGGDGDDGDHIDDHGEVDDDDDDGDHIDDNSDGDSDDENSFNSYGNKRVHRKNVISSAKKETKLVSPLKTCNRTVTRTGYYSALFSIVSI